MKRLMRTNLCHLLEQAAETRGSAAALTYKNTTCGYDELWHRVCSFASGLAAIGLGRGDRVAILLEKRIETVVAIFGTAAAGGVFVPVNTLLRPQQVAYILADCQVSVLVTTPGAADRTGQVSGCLRRHCSCRSGRRRGDLGR